MTQRSWLRRRSLCHVGWGTGDDGCTPGPWHMLPCGHEPQAVSSPARRPLEGQPLRGRPSSLPLIFSPCVQLSQIPEHLLSVRWGV